MTHIKTTQLLSVIGLALLSLPVTGFVSHPAVLIGIPVGVALLMVSGAVSFIRSEPYKACEPSAASVSAQPRRLEMS